MHDLTPATYIWSHLDQNGISLDTDVAVIRIRDLGSIDDIEDFRNASYLD